MGGVLAPAHLVIIVFLGALAGLATAALVYLVRRRTR